ncbi:DEAD/DEAH box helicase [Clostridium fallax]|uniref:ATP-dependent RNA helicase CshA n=1 Tax=Clostridium fallax TaxID=1533 RepID=A0A1M4U310_9CLOT|nr:DEAD/DEAH box helicase [Clostridium fallax]SHE51045.1 ATP-dependent RNA helicase DeaD [Clostridium fallax]SQB06050.1 ATP-dependent RNA helicase [Clostridium fallax]
MNNLTFSDLGLKDSILKAIQDLGFEEPSQIQSQSIPLAIEGHDLIGQAQTGTGKTAAFGCGILNNICKADKGAKAIILAPTRELAIQVNEELTRLAKYENLSIIPIYGGQSIDRQLKALRRGADIVVGTPGRILDHIKRGSLTLSSIKFLVLDEADEMLNMGFIDDLEAIISSLPEERQTLLFSATMPPQIKRLAKRYMKEDAKLIEIKKNSMTVSKIQQYYFEIKNKDRFETLCRVLDFDEPSAAIIFCKTKKGVDELVGSMQARGYIVEGMHGDMTQMHRMQTLRKFKESSLDFLVATDVAARGIDVEGVTHVINYDLPQDVESYVHRIGRTGRANKEGTAYSLVTPKEYTMLKQIQKVTKSNIQRKTVPTVDEIFSNKFQGMMDKIKSTIETEDFSKFLPMALELDENYSLVDVAAALMKIHFDKEAVMDYSTNALESPSMEETRLFFSIGRRDGINPKVLVNYIKDTSKIRPSLIGDIDVLENFTFVNVDSDMAKKVLECCSGNKLGGRRVNVEVANKSGNSKKSGGSNRNFRRDNSKKGRTFNNSRN